MKAIPQTDRTTPSLTLDEQVDIGLLMADLTAIFRRFLVNHPDGFGMADSSDLILCAADMSLTRAERGLVGVGRRGMSPC